MFESRRDGRTTGPDGGRALEGLPILELPGREVTSESYLTLGCDERWIPDCSGVQDVAVDRW